MAKTSESIVRVFHVAAFLLMGAMLAVGPGCEQSWVVAGGEDAEGATEGDASGGAPAQDQPNVAQRPEPSDAGNSGGGQAAGDAVAGGAGGQGQQPQQDPRPPKPPPEQRPPDDGVVAPGPVVEAKGPPLWVSVTSPKRVAIAPPAMARGNAKFVRTRDLGIAAETTGKYGGRVQKGERVNSAASVEAAARTHASTMPTAASIEPLRYWESVQGAAGTQDAAELYVAVARSLGPEGGIWGFPYTPRPGGLAAMRQRNDKAAGPIAKATGAFHVVAPLFEEISAADAGKIMGAVIDEARRLAPEKKVYVWLDPDALAPGADGVEAPIPADVLEAVLRAVAEREVAGVVMWYGVSKPSDSKVINDYNRWTREVLEPTWRRVFG